MKIEQAYPLGFFESLNISKGKIRSRKCWHFLLFCYWKEYVAKIASSLIANVLM